MVYRSIEHESTYVSWSPLDPADFDESSIGHNECMKQYPLAKHAMGLHMKVEVKAGETLYLPAMWFHRVTQAEETIAINYWHDMKYNMKYVYYNLIDSLSTKDSKA